MDSPFKLLQNPGSQPAQAFDSSWSDFVPFSSPERSERWENCFSPVGLMGRIGREIFSTRPPDLDMDLEKSLNFGDRVPVALPRRPVYDDRTPHIDTVLLNSSPFCPPNASVLLPIPLAAPVFLAAPVDIPLSTSSSTNSDLVHNHTEFQANEEDPSVPEASASPQAAQTVELHQPSTTQSEMNIQSQIISGPGRLSIDGNGFTLFPQPRTRRDVIFMLGIGVPIGQFVQATVQNGKWYCCGRHVLSANGRWVVTSNPCNMSPMSSKDIFDRHVKRKHLMVAREAGNTPSGKPIYDLCVWASNCGYILPEAKLRNINDTYRIDWSKTSSYASPQSTGS